MSAFSGKADMRFCTAHICLCPKADIFLPHVAGPSAIPTANLVMAVTSRIYLRSRLYLEFQSWRGPCLLGQDANTRKRFSQSHWPLERFLYWPTLFRRDEPSHVKEAALGLTRITDSTHAARSLGERDMDKTVARYNIEHYRKLLANETDEARRQAIARLLAEEEGKLAALENQTKKRKTYR